MSGRGRRPGAKVLYVDGGVRGCRFAGEQMSGRAKVLPLYIAASSCDDDDNIALSVGCRSRHREDDWHGN